MHSEPGYRVVTNFRTVNVLGFATGRQVVSEGRGPYQQYGLMKEIVSSLDELSHFFQHPNLSYLQRHNISLVIVSKKFKGITRDFPPVDYETVVRSITAQPYLKRVYKNRWMRAYKVIPPESRVE